MKKIICCFLTLLLAAALLCGCRADISAYADAEIRVTGLPCGELTVTPSELAEMDCVSADVNGKSGAERAWGPTLETFLAAYGVTLDEVRYVRFLASDDYHGSVSAKIWEKSPVILSVANGSKPLDAWQQPLRVVIPEGASSTWVRLVTEISVEMKEE